jgi:AraC-like DNA-binding protein
MTSPVSTMTRTDEVTTTEPEVAHDWLQAAYPDYRPEESNSHRGFQFRATHSAVGPSSVARLRYSTSADNNVVLDSVLLVLQPFDGHMKVRLGRDEEAVTTGESVLFPAHQTVSALWDDAHVGCLCLRAADVERVAVETTGMETLTLRFTGVRPMSPGRGMRWNEGVRALMRTALHHPEITATPMIASRWTDLLAAALLGTFPSTTLASHRRIPPGYAAPAVVRRAVDHIDANAGRELNLSEIATASGTRPRSLQAAFLLHEDTTPVAYARRVRMDRAHRALQAADPERDTVPAIAARWGFPDPHRFASEYEQAYRRPPGAVLRG